MALNLFHDKKHINDSTFQVKYKKVNNSNTWIKGIIAGKYPISIYLEFYKSSGAHSGVYAVKGFYYYDKVKKEIPLVGICDGGLTLYQFEPKKEKEFLEDFELGVSDKNFWDELDVYKDLSGYIEKFSIINPAMGSWISKGKSLNVSFTGNDLRIFEEHEFLDIRFNASRKQVDLNTMLPQLRGFEVIRYLTNEQGLRVLLSYRYSSRAYALGMCGAGEEAGYVILNFSKEINVTREEKLVTESCLDNIYSEEIKNSTDGIKEWKRVTDEETKTIRINENKISFSVE
jgi:hypothetical protein